MLDELQRVQIALHDMLSQPDLKKINISKLCLEAGISRRTFYLRYGKINNCIEACILLELKKELRKNEKNSLRQILNSLCSYIQKHKQYFYNAYNFNVHEKNTQSRGKSILPIYFLPSRLLTQYPKPPASQQPDSEWHCRFPEHLP